MFTQNTTHSTIKEANENSKWVHIDAENQVVGRLATQIADILRGKNSPNYSPNLDCGDFVVVTNCEKVRFTGNKLEKKTYFWHTGYIGGIKKRTAKVQMERKPEEILRNAVKGMVGKNSLGRKQMKKLRLFVGPEHTHAAQEPQAYTLEDRYNKNK